MRLMRRGAAVQPRWEPRPELCRRRLFPDAVRPRIPGRDPARRQAVGQGRRALPPGPEGRDRPPPADPRRHSRPDLRPRTALAAVAAVDVDVAMRQIAGPNRRPARAKAELDRDTDLAARHML